MHFGQAQAVLLQDAKYYGRIAEQRMAERSSELHERNRKTCHPYSPKNELCTVAATFAPIPSSVKHVTYRRVATDRVAMRVTERDGFVYVWTGSEEPADLPEQTVLPPEGFTVRYFHAELLRIELHVFSQQMASIIRPSSWAYLQKKHTQGQQIALSGP